MQYINTEKEIIKSWCNNPEEGALKQARNLANLPFIFRQVCLMPDTHEGYGMPIGGVIATQGVIIPNAVGVDIGCGMLAVRTSLQEIDIETLKKIMSDIRESVPVGFNHHKEKQDSYFIPNPIDFAINKQEYENAFYQVGTLGGGNHFIEIQKGDDGFIWYMIHSGSRNVGLKVAKYYDKLAQTLNQRWFSSVEKSVELAFLPIETKEAKEYLEEMKWCLDFSNRNRELMSLQISRAFLNYTNCTLLESINIQHNYARFEHHFGKDVLIHRKGATSASARELGIIPGSQGTSSYIVEGLGNPESFESCSHGAGRKMGRKQATRELSLENETKLLNDKGIIHSIRNIQDLDEATGAYKDIDTVMEEQKDLVKIKVKLTPLAVIKG
jgi:tRNA-splicing ligase RtcB